MAPEPPATQFRRHLQASVAASAAPYGYTITIWSAGAVTMHELGQPGLAQALLYMAGAVLAFVLVEAAAYGSLRVRLATHEPPLIAVWGNAHWVSAGVAITAVWLIDDVTKSSVDWPLASFSATAIYLLLNAAQTTFATVVEEAIEEDHRT